MPCGICLNLCATWPMPKPMCHIAYISAMWHRSKWVPCGRMLFDTNIVAILIAISFVYTLYGGHIYVFDEKIFHLSHVTGFCMQLVICYYKKISCKYHFRLKINFK